jgi:hypothetical protein
VTLGSQQYANLADHSYGRDQQGDAVDLKALVGKTAEIEGVKYKVLAHADKPSGYQGTIYQRVDTGEIVVAHRGTEFGREPLGDGLFADGGMVFGRVNGQAKDAIELTRHALKEAEKLAVKQGGQAPTVTTTGHSLGGTLAQITAHHFDLRGETFNAYGAASLDRRIPEGGSRVINHVMAADVVSAASPHYGQVRIHATAGEITQLRAAGYNNVAIAGALVPDSPLLASVNGSHLMHNFLNVDGDGRRDVSVLGNPDARTRADEHARMIGRYRDDVADLRRALTVGARGPVGLIDDAVDALRGPLPPGAPALRDEDRRSGRAPGAVPPSPEPRSQLFGPSAPLGELPGYRGEPDTRAPFRPGHAPPPPGDPCRAPVSDMRDPAHPAHARYLQAHAGVAALERAHGREPGASTERLAAALTASSAELATIAHVVPSLDGRRLFAVDTPDLHAEWRQRAHVDVDAALLTPLEASHRQWQASSEALMQRQGPDWTREQPQALARAPTLA